MRDFPKTDFDEDTVVALMDDPILDTMARDLWTRAQDDDAVSGSAADFLAAFRKGNDAAKRVISRTYQGRGGTEGGANVTEAFRRILETLED